MILSDLSAEQREYLAEEAEFELSRRSYEEYFMMTQNWGRDEGDAKRTVMYPYTKMICNALQPILDGERRFLIVEMPPQHGKSTTITETFPSAFLMKNPDKEVMVTSYADDLAQRFGTRNLEKFDQFAGRMYGLKVSDRKHTANEWQIAGHRGAMHSTTILGAATGKHADLLIVDDPLKDMQQANSPTIRKKILEEWQGSLNSRLSADASIIVIMTRWHVSDLAGYLLAEQALPWQELRLPLVAEEHDPLGRSVGETLAPGKPLFKDKKWAEEKRVVSGSKVWAALYQQRPVIEGGNIFKSDQVHYYLPNAATASKLGLDHDDSVAILPTLDKMWCSWDLTFTDKDTSDFVAGQTWGKQGSNFYLLDRVHGRMSFPQQIEAIKSMSQRHPESSAVFVEDKANGSAVITQIRNYISGVIGVVPKGDKTARASVVVPFFEAGNIYLPHPRWQPWVREMLDEWTGFPNMEHDDEVDSMTQALSQNMASKMPEASVYEHSLYGGVLH